MGVDLIEGPQNFFTSKRFGKLGIHIIYDSRWYGIGDVFSSTWEASGVNL